jgi:hypothetical protein
MMPGMTNIVVGYFFFWAKTSPIIPMKRDAIKEAATIDGYIFIDKRYPAHPIAPDSPDTTIASNGTLKRNAKPAVAKKPYKICSIIVYLQLHTIY